MAFLTGASLEPSSASNRMSAAIVRLRSSALPSTRPRPTRAFSGVVAISTRLYSQVTGACTSSGLGASADGSSPAATAASMRRLAALDCDR